MAHLRMTFLLLMWFLPASAIGAPAWRWDHETASCALKQDIASTGESVEITQTPAGSDSTISLDAMSDWSGRDGKFPDAVVTFVPSGTVKADVILSANHKKVHAFALTQDPNFLQHFAGASEVQIAVPNMQPLRLPLRSTTAAANAIRACENTKLSGWGIDPSAWRSLKSGPIPLQSLRAMFSSDIYPMEAVQFRVGGWAITRLDVAGDGSVTACKSVNPHDYDGFEWATCRVLKRARFRPAIDATGKPASAPYMVIVQFGFEN